MKKPSNMQKFIIFGFLTELFHIFSGTLSNRVLTTAPRFKNQKKLGAIYGISPSTRSSSSPSTGQ